MKKTALTAITAALLLFGSCSTVNIKNNQLPEVQKPKKIRHENFSVYSGCSHEKLTDFSSSTEQRVQEIYDLVSEKHNFKKGEPLLIILGGEQKIIRVRKKSNEFFYDSEYSVSTGSQGFSVGKIDFGKTPCGLFMVWDKFGEGMPIGTNFVAREAQPDLVKILAQYEPNKEPYMTTRILQLQGMEECNRDALKERVYIHGTSREYNIGKPSSHGCIRMKNEEIIKLFDSVPSGSYVYIDPGKKQLEILLNQKETK